MISIQENISVFYGLMMRRSICITVLMGVSLLASTQDTLRIDDLLARADRLKYDQPEQCILLSKEAESLSAASKLNDRRQKALALIGHGFFELDELDSLEYYLKRKVQIARDDKDYKNLAESLDLYANDLLYNLGRPEEGGKTYEAAAVQWANFQDTFQRARSLYSAGLAYHSTDMYDLSMRLFSNSLEVFEQLENENWQGNVLEMIGVIHKQLGNYDKSFEVHAQSRQLFTKNNNYSGLAQNTSNLGILYKEIGDYEQSLEQYDQLFDLAKEHNLRGSLNAYYNNSATLLNLMGRYIQAAENASKGYEMGVERRSTMIQADAKSSLAKSLLGQKKYNQALKEVHIALDLSRRVKGLEKIQDAHEVAKDILLALNRHEEAIMHLEAYQMITDSIFQIEQTKQINELQTQYETAKKDAEILLLNKNAEIADIRRKGLLGGLILLGVAALMAIFGLRQRHKKKQSLLAQEKQEAIHKRQEAEQQLEFKKKELMAKALQLASKNEFLENLESELSDLKSKFGVTIGNSTDKISKMITHDSNEMAEWDQFTQEFSTIHQEFLDTLMDQYGSFTQSELRLISLLKMNLASKDIANILRISDMGIKKARYRLRKKMNLAHGDDLQAIILSL